MGPNALAQDEGKRRGKVLSGLPWYPKEESTQLIRPNPSGEVGKKKDVNSLLPNGKRRKGGENGSES